MFNRLSTTMRSILIAIAALAITGCASTDRPMHRDYKSYDPCIKCGEKWSQLPNAPFEALTRYDRGERW